MIKTPLHPPQARAYMSYEPSLLQMWSTTNLRDFASMFASGSLEFSLESTFSHKMTFLMYLNHNMMHAITFQWLSHGPLGIG